MGSISLGFLFCFALFCCLCIWCFVCMCVCTMWVLGIESGFSGRAASALNHPLSYLTCPSMCFETMAPTGQNYKCTYFVHLSYVHFGESNPGPQACVASTYLLSRLHGLHLPYPPSNLSFLFWCFERSYCKASSVNDSD